MSDAAESGWYLGIAKEGSSETREFGSRFLGYCRKAEHVDDLRAQLSQIKKDHPQATHWCSASRLNPLVPELRSNDDGEPAHTAGTPILHAIQSSGVHNVWVGVVRYYGGTKLGRPGLIKAYKECAEAALADAVFERIEIERMLRIDTPFEDEHLFYRLAQRNGLKIKSLDKGLRSCLGLYIPLLRFDELEIEVQKLAQSTASKIELSDT